MFYVRSSSQRKIFSLQFYSCHWEIIINKHVLRRYDAIKTCAWNFFKFFRFSEYFIIGKYVKIRFKNWGSPCYFLSSGVQKNKNITKIENTIDDFFFLTLTVRRTFHRKDFKWKTYGDMGLFFEKMEAIDAELNERAEATTSNYSAAVDFWYYIY